MERDYPKNEEKTRLKKIILQTFKERYESFKAGKKQRVELYAGDFLPLPSKSLTSLRPLQIVLPSDIFMSLEYEELYTEFIKTFSGDLADFNIIEETDAEIPEGRTEALEIFLKEHPGEEMAYKCILYPLGLNSFEGTIEDKRYYPGRRNRGPLSGIWTATKYPWHEPLNML